MRQNVPPDWREQQAGDNIRGFLASQRAWLAKIVAAGQICGMPATTENVAALVRDGVRYIYTHLPRLLGAGATPFLKNVRSNG